MYKFLSAFMFFFLFITVYYAYSYEKDLPLKVGLFVQFPFIIHAIVSLPLS